MSLQRLTQWLLPREQRFFDLLEQQANVTAAAATALSAIREPGAEPEAVVSAVAAIERQSEGIARDVLHALSKTFLTPFDREDIQLLSKRFDDIVGLASQTARACVLFAVGRPSEMTGEMIERLVEATALLARNTPLLRQRAYAELIARNAEVGRLEEAGDALYRAALSALFHDPAVDAKTILKEKEVLQALERGLDRCLQAAEILTNVAVKHA